MWQSNARYVEQPKSLSLIQDSKVLTPPWPATKSIKSSTSLSAPQRADTLMRDILMELGIAQPKPSTLGSEEGSEMLKGLFKRPAYLQDYVGRLKVLSSQESIRPETQEHYGILCELLKQVAENDPKPSMDNSSRLLEFDASKIRRLEEQIQAAQCELGSIRTFLNQTSVDYETVIQRLQATLQMICVLETPQ